MRRLLIWNRGEIAVRIIRACREMGIESVAVYSDADAEAMHVKMADHAVHIGPTPSSQSYLVQEKAIEVAGATGADALHPGYGFLSENAGFARKVIAAGINWVGPSPEAMDAMGDKVSARANAEAAGVPLAAGSEVLRDVDHALEEANRIGYPVMMKASAGGGGIGMRILRGDDDLRDQFQPATDQAQAAFGVPDLFLERFIERPRHIEVQVIGDKHGNVAHLFERECSIQRRHQKLVEEAPSPALSDDERREIGAKAVQLAKQVGYENAGTLEFLFERVDGKPQWSFNEMNTRLQVEHPVTELVTGVDLVQTQLRVAMGEPLPFTQEDIKLKGHAFEARINAEDPLQGFSPSPGKVTGLQLPTGPGVRIDGCLYTGWTVPDSYDSMVTKLLVHGNDRDAAAARMRRALGEMNVHGFATNKPWHEALFANNKFLAADMSTRFLEENDLLEEAATNDDGARRAAAIALALAQAPGGGLAGYKMRQDRPRTIRPSVPKEALP